MGESNCVERNGGGRQGDMSSGRAELTREEEEKGEMQDSLQSIALDVAKSVTGHHEAAEVASRRVENLVEAILASLDELEMLIGVAKGEFSEEKERMIPFFEELSERLQKDYRHIDQLSDRIKALHSVVGHMEQEVQRVEKAVTPSMQADISEKFKQLQTSMLDQSSVVKNKMKGVTEKGVTSLMSVKDQVSQSEGMQKMKELGKKNLTDMKAKGSKFFKMLKSKS